MTKAKINDTRAMPGAFRFRKGASADLPHCAKLLPPGFRASPSVQEHLVDLWHQLRAIEAQTFTVVEDLEQEYPAKIEGFGLSVFVSDDFVEEFCAAPQPYVSTLFYERMLAGDNVVLTNGQLAAANAAGGINILSLHFGLRNHDLADPRTTQALIGGSAGFYFFHSGYRINTIINEVYGAQAAHFMEAGGLRLVHNFPQLMPDAFSDSAPDHYPYLFMLRRAWVGQGAVNPLSQLFFASPPRIYFSASERRVLELALLNETDRAAAAGLGVSADAIKKTWRSIYERISKRAPYLLPTDGNAISGSRGQEKRRHVLDYLRTHLEELRPWPD